jgi:hypothetical protein
VVRGTAIGCDGDLLEVAGRDLVPEDVGVVRRVLRHQAVAAGEHHEATVAAELRTHAVGPRLRALFGLADPDQGVGQGVVEENVTAGVRVICHQVRGVGLEHHVAPVGADLRL